MEDIIDILNQVRLEINEAQTKFPPFNSAHEGFSVMNEEVDELWEHVKVKQGKRDVPAMQKEAVQIAAMAIRFAYDVCVKQKGQR